MKRGRIFQRQDTVFAYLMSLPVVVYLLCILFVPIVWGIYISFTNKTIGSVPQFIGLKNYIDIAKDPSFIKSVLNTIIYTTFAIGGKAFFGLIMALLLNMNFKGRNLARALLLIPWTLPNVVSVLNWKWIFSPLGGVINFILKILGIIDTDIIWFGSAKLAMAAIILVNVWRGAPFFGISILSKLQTIPTELYEASDIDGANTFKKFVYITLPAIIDVILLVTLVSTIWTLNDFESAWLLTGGGPSGATTLVSIYSYKTAIAAMQLGKGIAVAVFAMPILVLLIIGVTKKSFAEINE